MSTLQTDQSPPRASAVKAVRATAIVTLIAEAVVLLLAIQPLRQIGGIGGGEIMILLGLVTLCVGACFVLRQPWGWHAVGVLQLGVIAYGLVHVSVAVIGVLFAAVWIYVLRVRKTITSAAD